MTPQEQKAIECLNPAKAKPWGWASPDAARYHVTAYVTVCALIARLEAETERAQAPVEVRATFPEGTRDLADLLPAVARHLFSLDSDSWMLAQEVQRASILDANRYSPHGKEREHFRLLYGFMLDCNVLGAKEAGVNLARGIKESAVLAKVQP